MTATYTFDVSSSLDGYGSPEMGVITRLRLAWDVLRREAAAP
jgi:hypothetical protein